MRLLTVFVLHGFGLAYSQIKYRSKTSRLGQLHLSFSGKKQYPALQNIDLYCQVDSVLNFILPLVESASHFNLYTAGADLLSFYSGRENTLIIAIGIGKLIGSD